MTGRAHRAATHTVSVFLFSPFFLKTSPAAAHSPTRSPSGRLSHSGRRRNRDSAASLAVVTFQQQQLFFLFFFLLAPSLGIPLGAQCRANLFQQPGGT